MLRRVLVLAAGFLVLLGLGIGAGLALHTVVGSGAAAWERSVTDWFVARRTGGCTDALKPLQLLGRSELMLLLVAAGGALLAVGPRRVGAFLLVACFGAEMLVDLIKPVVDRARPPARLWLERTGSGAFPSGHALISTVITIATVAAVGALLGRRVPGWGWCVAAVVPLVIGLSRVYLGVHWITDVVMGWLLGGLWVALVIREVLDDPAARSVSYADGNLTS
jgi:membrane-associated phospholipid phosphatase